MANYQSMVRAIQKIAANYLGQLALTEYCPGTVTAAHPLAIKISDRITIKEESGQIILMEAVLEKQLDLTHVHQVLGETEIMNAHAHPIDFDSQKELTTKITINEGLKVGDKVHLLRVNQGQRYLVLSKIREQRKVVIDKENQWKWGDE